MSRGYKETMWAGLSNYECELCPYSTLDLDDINEHLFVRHGDFEGGPQAKTSADGLKTPEVEPAKTEEPFSAGTHRAKTEEPFSAGTHRNEERSKAEEKAKAESKEGEK